MKIPDKVYDIMKWVVIIVLPASATLYKALSSVWGWPFANEVVTTIVAVTAFLGALLGISTAQYNKEVSGRGGGE